jgi:hypothetical protein
MIKMEICLPGVFLEPQLKNEEVYITAYASNLTETQNQIIKLILSGLKPKKDIFDKTKHTSVYLFIPEV